MVKGIMLTPLSIFLLENGEPNTTRIFLIAWLTLCIIGIPLLLIWRKKALKNPHKYDKYRVFLYDPSQEYSSEQKETINKMLSKSSQIQEPIIVALVLDTGKHAIILTAQKLYLLIDKEGAFQTTLLEKPISSFTKFEIAPLNLYAHFHDHLGAEQKYQLGFTTHQEEDLKTIKEFENLIANQVANQAMAFKDIIGIEIENGTVYFYENDGYILFNNTKINFDEINDVKLIIDNGKTSHSASLGGALFGGLLFGGIGAIIGSNMGDTTKKVITSAIISILTNRLQTPSYDFVLSSKEISYGTKEYQNLDKIIRTLSSMFEIIKKRNEK